MRVLLLAPFLAGLAIARPAHACAPAPRSGERVQIADESAVVAWDAATHEEQFIRRASFRTTGKDFGFLVPTPSQPKLDEVGDDLFQRLERATQPEEIHRTEREIVPALGCGLMFAVGSRSKALVAARAPVRVLDEERVAGFDAVVLEADSATALSGWLDQHGYAQRPELAAWLAPYVADKWKVTAFKVAPPQGSAHAGDPLAVDPSGVGSVATAAVRMTFTTPRPFFPYREPTDQRDGSSARDASPHRLLRVFFLGAERVVGTLGDAHAPWPGRTVWADRVDAAQLGALPFPLASGAWITKLEDTASPRPGTDDLYFSPSADRGAVKPPPVVTIHRQEIPLPMDLLAAAGVGGAWLVRRARRSSARHRAA